MKIIEPSAHIENLPENIYQRIDAAASVCYQRPAKPTVEEAVEFCRGMIKRKHWMPLEFATVHLVIPRGFQHCFDGYKYLMVEGLDRRDCLITGSIRALREAYGKNVSMLRGWLGDNYFLFSDGEESRYPDFLIRFAQPPEIPRQHEHVAVRVVCSRAISHQLVRHRPCAILQESQRYCRYDGDRFDGEVTFIRPEWTDRGDWMRKKFESDCAVSEERYFDRLRHKLSPQEARGALTNDAKTELLMYANLPEWQHILNEETMRCSSHADPEMQRIMKPLREEFKGRWPEQFK